MPLFIIFFHIRSSRTKTINLFSTLTFNSISAKLLTISILSAAGIPPFLGFFSKIFIFTLLCSNYIAILFVIFFILLFTGLYFYMQNIRFLNSTSALNRNIVFEKNNRCVTSFHYTCFPITLLLITGFTFTDDILLFFN